MDPYPTSDAPPAPSNTIAPEDRWVMPWEMPGILVGRVLDTVDRTVSQGATTVREVAPTIIEKVDEAQDEGVGLTERVLTAIAGITFGVPTTAVLVAGGALAVDQVAFKGAGRKALLALL